MFGGGGFFEAEGGFGPGLGFFGVFHAPGEVEHGGEVGCIKLVEFVCGDVR